MEWFFLLKVPQWFCLPSLSLSLSLPISTKSCALSFLAWEKKRKSLLIILEAASLAIILVWGVLGGSLGLSREAREQLVARLCVGSSTFSVFVESERLSGEALNAPVPLPVFTRSLHAPPPQPPHPPPHSGLNLFPTVSLLSAGLWHLCWSYGVAFISNVEPSVYWVPALCVPDVGPL